MTIDATQDAVSRQDGPAWAAAAYAAGLEWIDRNCESPDCGHWGPGCNRCYGTGIERIQVLAEWARPYDP